MRGFLIISLIFLLFAQIPADASIKIFQKKDYKQIFLNDARNAEKKNNDKQAFHSYEKALYYYKKDEKVIDAYAQFCERRKFFDRAEELYGRLYTLTKNKKYLFKKNLCAVKNGKLSHQELYDFTKSAGMNSTQKNELNSALIYHFSFKQDWASVKKTCDKIPKNKIGADIIIQCLASSEKTKDKKSSLGYALRFSELNPQSPEGINRVLNLADELKDFPIQEQYIKKLSTQNPTDRGIKYRWAGIYEKHGDWAKAAKIYEALMADGDLSEHVKASHAYVLSQLNPQKTAAKSRNIEPYKPKPLSGYKLSEKLFYEALDKKEYKKSQIYLGQMLKKQPTNPKLLKHRVDIEFALENYSQAITALEKLQKTKPLSAEDEKFLAFLYSKTENEGKSLEIIENMLAKKPNDKELLNLALTYSMAQKNWDKALVFTDKLLELEPNSEKLLKSKGDLLSINKDFTNAAIAYEKLVAQYPNPEYEFELANLYMANQDFENAQTVLEPIYQANQDNSKVVYAYLNSILAQSKTREAYFLIRKHHLEYTKEGYMVAGDIATKDKDYELAARNYRNALSLAPDDLMLQNKLANSYRMLGYIVGPTQMFSQVLAKDPQNLEAQLGLGALEIEKKNFADARNIFRSILRTNPDYRPAKTAIAYAYIAEDYKLSALDVLDQLPQDDETKLIKAQVYYDINMWSNAQRTVKNVTGKDAEALKYQIRRNGAITLTPSYSFLKQQLADEFILNYNRYGLHLAKNVEGNKNVFLDYNIYAYASGPRDHLMNVTNEIRGGVQARPSRKWEYRADLGVKAFQFGGAMLNTDSWIKHYFNDKFNLRLGFRRNNLEQSYVSAVGEDISGYFTGRVADNKIYTEYEAKLPNKFYSFGRGGYGIYTAQNLPTNQYLEGMAGVGKLVYNNQRNPWIQKVGLDIVTYNASYQYNLLNLYSNTGKLYGGYFSPGFFTAETLNIKLEGEIKKWHTKYGLTGFGGIQITELPNHTNFTWGFGPYMSYDLNDYIAINASYNYYNFADVQRHYFMVNAVIRGFKKYAKN